MIIMLINEDFFDSEDLSREEMMKNANSPELVENDSFRYVASVHYDSADICDLNYFEKVVDKLATNIEHSAFSSEEINSERYIVFEFNHSFKNINESMQFLRIIFEALKRPLKGMWKFELVDRTPLSDDAEECQVSLKLLGGRWLEPYKMRVGDDNKLIHELYFLNVILLGSLVSYFDVCNYMMLPHNSSSEQESALIQIKRNHKYNSGTYIKYSDKSIWSSIDKIENIPFGFWNDVHIEVVEFNQQKQSLNSVVVGDGDLKRAIKMFKYGKKIISNKYFIVQYSWTYLFVEDDKQTVYIPIGQFPITDDHSMIYYVKITIGRDENIDSLFEFIKISKYA